MATKKVARKAHALRGELYRSLVLEAAEEEFAKYGFADARVQRVADSVGLSVGTLYNLFESKDGLYAELHRLRGTALMTRLGAALDGEGPVPERLANSVRALVGFTVEYPKYMRMVLQRGNAWSNQLSHPVPDQAFVKRSIGLAVSLCAAAIQRGELRAEDPRRLILTLTAVLQAQMASWLEDGMKEAPERVSARIVDLFARLYWK